MVRWREGLACVVTCAWTMGCAGAIRPPDPPQPPEPPTPEELAAWDDAVELYAQHEEARDWDGEACRETLSAFEQVSEQREGQNARAVYMMGLVAERCGSADRARALFTRALELEDDLCEARVAIALEHQRAGRGEQARAGFELAIADDNLCAPAYVNLAAMQAEVPAQREAAVANLRRALAARSDYLPAFDQLAQIYLAASEEQPALLDLAEVVCRQAQMIDPTYAPIHNTWALIDIARGDLTGAAAKLARATELDPRMFEAWMNFGQLTLSQRAYEDAARAFAAARELRPGSYDAAIGSGVALRGLSHPEQAERMYRAALEIDEDRPEAWFDLAVLYQEHRGGTAEDLDQAHEYLREFVGRAQRSGRFGDQVAEVLRWCSPSRSRRGRRRAECQMGRVQNVLQALIFLRNETGDPEMPAWVREARSD